VPLPPLGQELPRSPAYAPRAPDYAVSGLGIVPG